LLQHSFNFEASAPVQNEHGKSHEKWGAYGKNGEGSPEKIASLEKVDGSDLGSI
jgi:hypothetical protein